LPNFVAAHADSHAFVILKKGSASENAAERADSFSERGGTALV
jgi:hypothetical protein